MSKIFSVQLFDEIKKLDTAGQLALLVAAISLFGSGFYGGTYVSSQSAKIEVEKKSLEMDRLQLKTERLQSEATEKADLAERNLEITQGVVRELQQSEAGLKAALSGKTAQLERRTAEIFELRISNLLMIGFPYPVGFDQIRIGDPISKVAEVYSSKDVEERKRRTIVSDLDPLINRIFYDHSRREEDGIIYNITFDTGKRWRKFDNLPAIPDDLFVTALTRSLGEPRPSGRDKQCLWWFASDDDDSPLVFHIKDSGQFEIIAPHSAPSLCLPFYEKDGTTVLEAE